MQAFGNTHLVQAEAVWVCTRKNSAAQLVPSPAPPLALAPGGFVELTFTHPPLPVKSLRAALVNPPAGITLKDQVSSPGKLVLVFAAGPGVRAGIENLVLSLRGEPTDAQARTQEVDLGVLPAIVVNVAAKGP
jgi:hypothetical protein